MSIRQRIAQRLRFLADRIDWYGAPKMTHLSFTFELGEGVVIHEDGRGCPLWYLGNDDYERSWNESRCAS